jgi:hypothetical protein
MGFHQARRPGDKWLQASLLGLLVLIALGCRFGTDAGITLDERLQVEYGNQILAWFSSGFSDQSALTYRNLFLYGGLFDACAQWLTRYSPAGVYETRHLLSAFTAILGVVATWKIAAELGGARAGLLAALLLVLTPAWTGHGLFNPKDIPFGTAAAFSIYACVRIVRANAVLSWTDALRAGVAIGTALSVRPGGAFLLGYLLAAVLVSTADQLVHRVTTPGAPSRLRIVTTVSSRASAAVALAWLIMLSAWPWAQLAPFSRPFQAAANAARFGWRGVVLFDGASIPAGHLPASYLPVWFAITLPETYLFAAVAGVVMAVATRHSWRRNARDWLASVLVGSSIMVPIVAVIIRRPIIYDAHRHFLFLLPPLAALAGVACASFWASARVPRWLRTITLAAVTIVAGLTVRDMIALHPYEYVYFNRSFGGLPAAAGRFETEYWGASYKEGLAWLVRHVRSTPGTRQRVTWCHDAVPLDYYLERWPQAADRFEPTRKLTRAQFYLGSTRANCHTPAGEMLHRVEREGVPLLYVIRLPTPVSGSELPR